MDYDGEFWDRYAAENEARYNAGFAGFTRDLASSLRCTSVLEVGCGTGIDLRLFPGTFRVCGIDLNDCALGLAREKLPEAELRNGTVAELPFEDSEIDFVFTHGLLNYLDDDTLERGVAEMYRVAAKYVMNCEVFGETESPIGGNRKSRNMYRRWSGYNARIVSNVDMHEDIEPDKLRFTLLKKTRPISF